MKWISVKDRLPEEDFCEVLAYWKDYDDMAVVIFERTKKYRNVYTSFSSCCGCDSSQFFSDPLYWMPLPEPPIEKDEVE